MSVSFSVSAIRLVGGVTVTPPTNGMTLFVGPNNCGKSVLLRELDIYVANPGATTNYRWVEEAPCVSEGTGEEFLAWLDERRVRSWTPEVGRPAHYRTGEGQNVPADAIQFLWAQNRWDQFRGLLTRSQWTDNRLSVSAGEPMWNLAEPGQTPFQQLWEDRDLEAAFSDLMGQAFGTRVVVDRYGGQTIVLRVGDPQVTEEPLPPRPEVVTAFRGLPAVNEQGDGFKAFTQLLLHTMIRPTPVVIIDEPEAFLHPPQARLLGRLLASMPSPSQVFVATHSADFLAGVLDAETDRELSLVRLDRSGGRPTAQVLEPATVRELLRTPLLRYSHIISGLFHDRVVLCESEGDCQFYSAAFDVTRGTSAPHENTIFLHTSGKDRLADTARRLRAFGVPTAVITDFDLLNTHTKVRDAVNALGGSVRDMAGDIKVLNDHANSERTVPTVAGFRKEMQNVLVGRGNAPLTEAMVERMNKLIKGSSGWGALKKSGLNALNGDVLASARRLLKHTASHGLFIVPCGELEQWVRDVPSGNKAKWLTEVFEGDDHWYQNPTAELRHFCQQIRAYLNDPDAVSTRAET
ncbi:ATP-dependent nuclease [Streptomyces virginiae]